MNRKLELVLIATIIVAIVTVSLVSNIALKREMEVERADFEKRYTEVTKELTNKGLELKEKSDDLDVKTEEIEDLKVRLESLETSVTEVKAERDLEVDKLKGEIKKLKQREEKTKASRGLETKKATKVSQNTSGKSGTFQATAYCSCSKCCGKNAKGITATGTKVQANRTIAVDPRVIPLGSKVTIEGYGTYIAEDTGSAVKGNIIDIYFGNHADALKFGRKSNMKVSW